MAPTNPRSWATALTLTGLLVCTGPGRSSAQQVNDEGLPFPAVALSKHARGEEIIGALGVKLPEVARWYKKTQKEFGDLCQRDKSLHADHQGKLHYLCDAPVFSAAAVAGTNQAVAAAGSIPDSQTFFLHSKPDSTHVIYLDFDGNTTTGTLWNSSVTKGAAIVTPPYDVDGNPSSFSTQELANIREIWQRVAEAYAPFDVDVTTQDPGLEALRKTSSADVYYGVRACIGGSSSDWLKSGSGGIAYVGSFNWNSDTPAFVFPAQLGSGNPKYVAISVAHEVGHTMGLSHDGQTNGTEYYAGHGNWAPIMGSGFSRSVVQWSKGEYALANNTEDDVAIIAKMVGYRVDQAGDDILHAKPLAGTSPSAAGIIETRTDADLYSFTTGAGSISFTATPDSLQPNLDIQLALYNGAGNLVTSSADSAGMGATLTATLPQGTYYIAVDGIGTGNASTGYSDYGSLGQFTLSGTVVPVNGQSPVAVVSQSTPLSGIAPLTVSFSSAGSYDPDGTVAGYDWDFGDATTPSTAASTSHVYDKAGTYTASLVVFDDAGLSGIATTAINVQPPPVTNSVYVSAIAMKRSSTTSGYQATASVTVKDQTGALKSGATVTGQWSGLTTGSSSVLTNSKGVAAASSIRTKSRGTFIFTVTGITLSGYSYAPTKNVKTSGSISTP